MRDIIRFVIAAAVTLVATAPAARADFYRLDGRFECLGRVDAVCFDKTRAPPDPFAPAPPPAALHAPTVLQPAPVPIAPRPTHAASRTQDPILAIAARIERAHPEPDDLVALRRAAADGDPRAVELLAWCTLRGIGIARDPLQAYFLYGKAAALDVPHAGENQRLVFERSLNSAEREQLLEMQAAERPAPGFLSDADQVPRHVP